MTAKELEATLDVIAAKAKTLRDAGIVGRMSIGDITFEVAFSEVTQPMQQAVEDAPNPLDDPDTYGGYVPVPRRPGRPQEDEE